MNQLKLFEPDDNKEFFPVAFGFVWSTKASCWYLPQPFANVTIQEERTRDNQTRYIFKIDGEVAYNGFLRYNKEAKAIFNKFKITLN